jgi:HK97 family phage major capsid protein
MANETHVVTGPKPGQATTKNPVTGKVDSEVHAALDILERMESQIPEMRGLIDGHATEATEIRTAVEDMKAGISQLKGWAREMDDWRANHQKIITPPGVNPVAAGNKARMEAYDGIVRWMEDLRRWKIDQDASCRMGSNAVARAQSEGSDPAGGYLVDTVHMPYVTELVEMYGTARKILNVVDLSQIKGFKFQFPVHLDLPEVYHPDEGVATVTDSDVRFDKPELQVKRFQAHSIWSQELEADSIPAFRGIIPALFARGFAKREDEAAFIATVGSPGPNPHVFDGLLVISGVQELVMDAGQTTYASITESNLLDMIDTVSVFALTGRNVGWLASNSAYLAMRKNLKDQDGRSIWADITNPAALGVPQMLEGYPMYRSEVMPGQSVASQADTSWLLFGAFGDAHAMGVRNDYAVDFSRDLRFLNNQTVMKIWERVGYQLLLGQAVAKMTTHA